MKYSGKKRKSEYGGTMVEAFFCMLVICLILFGLLQIFHWSVAKILCEYSSFYAAKGEALGYNQGIVERAAQVALTGVSGADESIIPAMAPYSRYDLSERAADYMMYSDGGMYGVDFEYWEDYQSGTTPYIDVQHENNGNYASADVTIQNMPLLDESFANFVYVDRINISTVDPSNNQPRGESIMYNHSQYYLDE
ncbi:MAG: hypothetical protein L3J71_14195 [Victivallaceae bacterium]|nr:hypothetical protein [Victivallaceae bacterium]